jgi:hypothetical protein
MANFKGFKLARRDMNGKDNSTALTATRHSFYVDFLLGSWEFIVHCKPSRDEENELTTNLIYLTQDRMTFIIKLDLSVLLRLS